MERNIIVETKMTVKHPFEFELTRNKHMNEPKCPFTVTAMFKEPTPELVPEAWRILLEVTKGKTLFPQHVVNYKDRVLERWTNGQLRSQKGSTKK